MTNRRICESVYDGSASFLLFSYRRRAKGQATGVRKKFNDSKFKKH